MRSSSGVVSRNVSLVATDEAFHYRHLAKEGYPHDQCYAFESGICARARAHSEHRIVLVVAQARDHRELPQSVEEVFAFVSQ